MATKIYTKTGDDGTTGLFGGDRVSKHHARIAAYGTLDELNAVLGVAIAVGLPIRLQGTMLEISALLFTAGADLATPMPVPAPQSVLADDKASKTYPIPRIEERHVAYLERLIDEYDSELAPLQAFILPTGTLAAAHLHLARTVCRRVERHAVELAGYENIGEYMLKFLNRLSDYLFEAARMANRLADVPDVPWENPAL
jgi:cob(I)alamin adenosyltransferase